MASAVQSTLTTAMAGSDNDLTLTSKFDPTTGNNTSITLIDPDDDSTLQLVVQEHAGADKTETRLLVLLESDDDTIITTAAQVRDLINNDPVGSKHVLVSCPDTKAAYDTDPDQGANAGLVFTSKLPGTEGNQITVAYTVPTDDNQAHAIDVSVSGHAITVQLAVDTDGSTITSTAANIKTAVDADPEASTMVSVANSGGNDGSGLAVVMAAKTLAGGLAGGAGAVIALAATKLASGVVASYGSQAEAEADGWKFLMYDSNDRTVGEIKDNQGNYHRLDITDATQSNVLAALSTRYNNLALRGLAPVP